MLCIDLHGFKAINDTNGHAAGDQLPRQVAEKVPPVARASDQLARQRGDELGFVASNLQEYEDARGARPGQRLLNGYVAFCILPGGLSGNCLAAAELDLNVPI